MFLTSVGLTKWQQRNTVTRILKCFPKIMRHSFILIKVLYMSFDMFLLAVESCDLSQADKGIIRVSSFPKLFLNDKIYRYTTKNYLALGNLAKLMFWSILSFKNLQD